LDIQEFRKDFLETVRSYAAADLDFQESAFVSVAAQKLMDAEELEDFEPCYYEGTGRRKRSLRVDGYSFDDVDNSAKLLIADYRGHDTPETLIQTEAERSFEKLGAFVEEAITGDLHMVLEESSPGFGLVNEIHRKIELINKFRFFLITDATLSSRVKDLASGTLQGKPVEYHVWDMSRFHRVFESSMGRDELEIDFREFLSDGIPCLEASQDGGDYKTYLCVSPGEVFAEIYDRYGSRLLEGNVRSFLGTKGGVNKGIRNTIIKEPEMFFAFNNGVAATATDAEIIVTDEGLRLIRAASLQIVNGGQTTVSLANTRRKDRADLSRVFVQMKLSVITPEKAESIIPEISRCANSQNKLAFADFFSNHPFHIRMEEISRRIWAPAIGGAQHETHWFYERARGQYLNEQTRMTQAERDRYQLKNPRANVITKTDLAKYHNAWRGLPHIVSFGAQKNFKAFAEWIAERWEQEDAHYNEEFYRESVALAILFRHTERMVPRQPWYQQGYRANIVAYTVAKLAAIIASCCSGKVLDLRSVWNRQAVTDAIDRQLTSISEAVFDVIVSPELGFQNVTEWCKKAACWTRVKGLDITIAGALKAELIDVSEERAANRNARAQQRVDNGIGAQIQVVNIGAIFWERLRSWANERGLIAAEENRILGIASRISTGILPTDRQSSLLLAIKERIETEGFF
jgi:hypothetical protein